MASPLWRNSETRATLAAMTGDLGLVVITFAFLTPAPARAAEGRTPDVGAAVLPSSKETSSAFDDDLPTTKLDPSKDSSCASGDCTPPTETSQQAGKPPPVPAPTQPPSEPQAPVAVKQEIQAVLERQDEPEVRRLMSQALTRYPADKELQDARSSLWSRMPPERARAIIDFSRAEVVKFFGRQWIPGKDSGEEIGLSIETAPRRGTRSFGGASAAAALSRGYGYLARGDAIMAELVLSKEMRGQRASAELYYARAMARAAGGDLKGADVDSLQAVSLSREHPVTLSQRASLMMAAGRRDEAFAWAERALAVSPDDADALAVRGRCLWRDKGRPETALQDLQRAAQLDPGRYQALYREGRRRLYEQLAVAGVGKGDLRAALANADKVLAVDPGSLQAHLVRGLVFWKQGKPEETIKDTTLALKTDPRSTWALFHRGLAMEALGQRERAIADFRRAAAIAPAKFQPMLERLLQAQREGRHEPVWPKEGVVAASN